MSPSKNRKRRVLVTLLLLLGGWWTYDRLGADDRPAKVRDLRAQLKGASARNLSPEQRRDLWKQFGTEMKQLSPAQRLDLARERQKEFQKRISAYFALPRSQKMAELDRQIKEMEKRRKEWAANAKGAAGPPGKGGLAAKDAETREQARKLRLDESTPEERAQRAEYFRQLNQRRQQFGLPVIRRK